MSQYDFDRVVDRYGTNSYKYDAMRKQYDNPNLLTLGCADNEIECPPAIVEAVKKRAEHAVYGYTIPGDELYQNVIKYYHRNHAMEIEKENIFFVPGILSGASFVINSIIADKKAERGMLITPEYPCFFRVMKNNNLQFLATKLVQGAELGEYRIDMEDFEKKLTQSTFLLFSNPHNPSGNILTEDEVRNIVELCRKHNVVMISDEIWCDVIIDKNKKHCSALRYLKDSDRAVVFVAGSKSYNIAGLGLGIGICKNKELLAQIKEKQQSVSMESGGLQLFNQVALNAAMTSCDKWLREFTAYIRGNMEYVRDFCKANIPEIKVYIPEATTLMWLDFSGLFDDSDKSLQFCLDANVYLAPGFDFFSEKSSMMRMNVGSYRRMIEEAMRRLKAQYDKIRNQ